MEAGRPNSSSDAARLGTAAHALGEACLLDKSDTVDWLGGVVRLDPNEYATAHRPESLPPPSDDPVVEDFTIDADMADAVQVYLDAVREEVERLGKHATLEVEQRFNLSWLVGYDYDEEAEADALAAGGYYVSPSGIRRNDAGDLEYMNGTPSYGPMFGTNDASVTLIFDHVTVFDYKHGQGVVVEVADNEQELYYALGRAETLDWAFETLDLVIVQPRARHSDGAVRRWSTTKAYLREFENRLRRAAQATEEPDALLHAGSHCKFCKASAVCPEMRAEAFRSAGVDFGDDGGEEPSATVSTAEDSDADLELRMRAIPLLDNFIKSTQTEALRRLRESETGEACFGKLVRKKSNRAFRTDLVEEVDGVEVPVNVFDKLEAAGLPRALLFEEPKAKTPSKVEALRPPELMAKLKEEKVKAPAAFIKGLVSQYSYKPEGGLAIAPLSDPRESVAPGTAAEGDFEASLGDDFSSAAD